MAHGGWNVALDDQIDLRRFWQSPMGRRYASGFVEDKRRKGQARVLDEHLIEVQEQMLFTASPVWVDPEVMDLLDVAIPSFRPETFRAEDVFIPSAFVVFPRPFSWKDVHEKLVSYRALAWAPMTSDDRERSGILIFEYSHCDDWEHDDYMRQYRDEGYGKLRFGSTPYSLVHYDTFWFGEDIHEYDASHWEMVKAFQAFSRLAQQRIATRFGHEPIRPVRKRALRAGWKHVPVINVVTLRRLYDPDQHPEEHESSVEWSHRWIVDGHWRNQWYPSEKRHKQIWIHAYPKGPEDKPLVVKKRAFELLR